MLAGVNGAGKSSLLGAMLAEDGATWFNPAAFTQALVEAGWAHEAANAEAWHEGRRRLERAIAHDADLAIETTLGGRTLTAMLAEACGRHAVTVWFCGLEGVELHLARIAARVAAGGHAIPEAKVRERYDTARANLIALMPGLAALHVYDNSAPADADGRVEPRLVLEMDARGIAFPRRAAELAATPDWAKPIVMAALRLHGAA